MTTKKFHYFNKEIVHMGGKRRVRTVSIKNGKGFKSVSHIHNGKHKKTVKRRIHPEHMKMIQQRKFVPGLFKDCRSNCKSKSKM
jgi:hypothetical protein